jgi:hypothetical protein
MLTLRNAIPRPQPLASAEFNTLRLRLIKIAARVIETATRVRIAFAASCPEAELFGGIARWLHPSGHFQPHEVRLEPFAPPPAGP